MSYQFRQGDVIAFANAHGYETYEKGNELFFKYCPYCQGGGHDKETFSINLETGAFKCFRASCNKHGHFVELARDFDYPLEQDGVKRKYRRLKQVKIETKDEALSYMQSRGISEEITKRYKLTVQKKNPKILVFPFFDENGVMVSAKYRKTDFVKGRDKNKEWFESETKPILFGMMQCKDFKRLIITEGQIDSLTVAECGFDNAVSVPTGANGFTWINNCYDWVNRFEEIIVFGDCEKNKITLAEDIVSRFPLKKIKVVRQADYLGEKDANDILRKYGKDAVRYCVENAEIKPVRAVKSLASVKKADLSGMERIKTGIYDIDKTIGGMYLGQLILITGKRGEGKSTLASQIFANAIDQGYSAFAYSGELPDYHFKNWLDLQIAGSQNIQERQNEYGETDYWLSDKTVERINDWYAEKAYIFDNNVMLDELAVDGRKNESGEEITLLGAMQQAVCRYGIKFVLLDNLMTALDVEPTSDLYRAQSEFVKKVKSIAVKLNIVVVLIAHPKKEQIGKELDNDSVSGSSDITNAVDVVITYSGNNDEDKETYQSLIGITKNRLTGRKLLKDNRVKVRYSEKSKRIICDNDNPNKVYGCFKNVKQLADLCEPPF
ncbi:AAA family ATPase [Porcipelethomonas sp.]|uniref:bifunctional DNA primase/helicase n=1 Tax=Porcipelethomonas sp. TaxID=2981675 RepID=UPI003EF15250